MVSYCILWLIQPVLGELPDPSICMKQEQSSSPGLCIHTTRIDQKWALKAGVYFCDTCNIMVRPVMAIRTITIDYY